MLLTQDRVCTYQHFIVVNKSKLTVASFGLWRDVSSLGFCGFEGTRNSSEGNERSKFFLSTSVKEDDKSNSLMVIIPSKVVELGLVEEGMSSRVEGNSSITTPLALSESSVRLSQRRKENRLPLVRGRDFLRNTEPGRVSLGVDVLTTLGNGDRESIVSQPTKR